MNSTGRWAAVGENMEALDQNLSGRSAIEDEHAQRGHEEDENDDGLRAIRR